MAAAAAAAAAAPGRRPPIYHHHQPPTEVADLLTLAQEAAAGHALLQLAQAGQPPTATGLSRPEQLASGPALLYGALDRQLADGESPGGGAQFCH